MKELSIEEKAKRYDGAIKQLRTMMPNWESLSYNGKTFLQDLVHIIPELKESEDWIPKEIIKYLKEKGDFRSCWIAWLEKQGEQKFEQKFFINDKVVHKATGKIWTIHHYLKDTNSYYVEDNDGLLHHYRENELKLVEQNPVDKVEPKFKVGDFIVNDYCMGRIVEITNDAYLLDTEQGIPFSCHSTRLWDIAKDAKDGDVIYSRHNTESFEWIGIFKSLDKENKRVFFYGFWHNMAKSFSVSSYDAFVLYDDFSPATKEQRDLLFQKMKESGYEWDAEKKELKKIKQPKLTEFEDAIKDMMDDYRDAIDDNAATVEEVKEKAAYLLSLIPCKPAWSEEDTQYINDTLALLSFGCSTHSVGEVKEWLQSLNNRVQPKQEWSEEDEKVIDDAESWLDMLCGYLKNNSSQYIPVVKEVISKLKSLKPHSTWKPSDEQMDALEDAIADAVSSIQKNMLNSLYQDLKKLKQ